jgi:kynurenine formamidase
MTMTVPDYDELPQLPGWDVRHAWDVWGRADRRGTLNHVTDERVLAALSVPRTGRRVNLSLPVDYFEPPLYGRNPIRHRVFDRNRNMVEDELAALDPQSSSQWDSLRHIRASRHGHYAGLAPDDPAVPELGIDQLARLGFVARAVLIDLPAMWARLGQEVDPLAEYSVSPEEVRSCLAGQGSEVGRGDLLMVRTGWLAAYRSRGIAPEALAMPPCAGLEASEATARMLWNWQVCALAADNPAVEVLPGDPAVGSLHRRLLAALGMPLGELWDLDELADVCRQRGSYDVCVVSAPLYVRGGVASPANAFAVL